MILEHAFYYDYLTSHGSPGKRNSYHKTHLQPVAKVSIVNFSQFSAL